MANGDIIRLDRQKFAIKLIDTQQGTTTGPWVEVPPSFSIWSLHAASPGTDTVSIQVSNAITTPSSTTSGGVLGFSQGVTSATTLTGADGTTTCIGWCPAVSFRWVRAIKTGATNTTTVILEADSNQ